MHLYSECYQARHQVFMDKKIPILSKTTLNQGVELSLTNRKLKDSKRFGLTSVRANHAGQHVTVLLRLLCIELD